MLWDLFILMSISSEGGGIRSLVFWEENSETKTQKNSIETAQNATETKVAHRIVEVSRS